METKSATVACICSLRGGYKVNTGLDRTIQRRTLLWQKFKVAKAAPLFLAVAVQTINLALPSVLEKELNEP